MKAGSISMPDPGPVGTVTAPFSVLNEDVLHSNGTSVAQAVEFVVVTADVVAGDLVEEVVGRIRHKRHIADVRWPVTAGSNRL
jgi:hypothetical protein